MDLAKDEGAILSILRSREGALIDLARELIATPSPNPPGDEREVADVARQAMADLGYVNIRTIARDEKRPNIVGEVGSGARSLVLNGHIDTVPPGNTTDWEDSPYGATIRGGRLYGLGSTDMKSAVAAMIHAGAAMAEATELGGILRVVLSADEENGSMFGTRYLLASGEVSANAVIVGEQCGLDSGFEYLSVASRGISCFRITVRGTQMHSSVSHLVPSVNASAKMASLLLRFHEGFAPRVSGIDASRVPPTVNVGVVVDGGVSYGVHPGEASFGIDVRTVPGMSFDELKEDVAEFIERLKAEDPDLDAEVHWIPGLDWFPPCLVETEHPLVAATAAAAEAVLGRPLPLGTMPAATDGSHWGSASIPTIPALGPGALPLAHSPNEYVEVQEIVQASCIYALAGLRFLV